MGKPLIHLPDLKKGLFIGDPELRSKYQERLVHYTSFIKKACRQNGDLVYINEEDPIDFLAQTFACIESSMSVLLGSSQWGSSEIQGVRKYANFTFGSEDLEVIEQVSFTLPKDSNPSIIFKTGGSSGKIQFACHTMESLTSAADSLALFLQKEDRVEALIKKEDSQVCFDYQGVEEHGFMNQWAMSSLITLPLHHVSGFMPIIRAIVSGGEVFFESFKKLKELCPKTVRNLWLSLVPTQLKELCGDASSLGILGEFRGIFMGGASMSEKVVSLCIEKQLPIYPCYGMTETAAMVSLMPKKQFLLEQRGVGYPLPGVQISLVKDGLISIESKSLFRGYLGACSFKKPRVPFVTEDMGTFAQDKSLILRGKKNQLINTGGEKVDPQEVMEVMERIFNRSLCVFSIEDARWGEKVVAVFEGNPFTEDSMAWKLQECKKILSQYKIPKSYKYVDKIPLLPSKKINFQKLKNLFAEEANGSF